MLPDSIPIQVLFVFVVIAYFIVGFIAAYYSREYFKNYMVEQLIPPLWQNFVFVMLIIVWPVFMFLVASTTFFLLLKDIQD